MGDAGQEKEDVVEKQCVCLKECYRLRVRSVDLVVMVSGQQQ